MDFVDPGLIDGVGLMRSEFAISSLADAANEEKQFDIYRRVLEWAGGKPVAIRMLDLGGDKQFAGIGGIGRDPFMGLRGIRLLLARPEMARVQARALLRSAVYGNLDVMLADGDDAFRSRGHAEIFREEAAASAAPRHSPQVPADRHHGRGAGGGAHAGHVRRGGFLLLRHQRPGAVSDRCRPR